MAAPGRGESGPGHDRHHGLRPGQRGRRGVPGASPEGDSVSAGETCGEIESAKTVSDLYAPVDGVVVATNGDLEDQPELVNDSPYGDGWMIRVRMADAAQLDDLLDASAYRALIEEH